MPMPRVAIVGRPNAGKSSLLNMIAGAKVSIVDPTPGVTRDRVTAIVELEAPENRGPRKPVEFIDTGGFGVYVASGERYDEVGSDLSTLTQSIESQIEQAVESADVILLCVDAQQGVTAHDREVARLLREHRLGPQSQGARKKGDGARTQGPPVHVVATKIDGPKWEGYAADLSNLGFGEPMMVSAKSNYFRREFLEKIWGMVPLWKGEETRPTDLMLAIVGKRNAGKSTLVNTMAGEERMIVSEIAGTTRDAVDVRMEWDGRSLVAIDTAGLRRRKSFQSMVEEFAFDRLKRAIDRADVALLLIDATERISQVDEQLAMMLQKAHKPVIIVVNKWDLAKGQIGRKGAEVTTGDYEDYLRKELIGLSFAPIAFISGKTGKNVQKTIDLAFELREQASTRVTTGKLNRLVRGIMETRSPTDTKGTHAKVFYVAQTDINPPTITLVVNVPDLFRPNYLRFLMNRFREELPFPEVPIRIVVRARRQREEDMATRSTDTIGEEILSDEHSSEVATMDLGDDAEKYFED
ncbi:MAG: ribosome biogenesis GTPase Der [Phycisphaerales bacterium]|nr:ribosome biogenesis GTPase Der [Phycisphaerales bacterium]